MNPLWNIPQFLMTAWLGNLTNKQFKAYQAAVEQQIAEGRSGLEARSRAAMDMIQNDPNTAEAQAILKAQKQNLPKSAYAEAERATKAYGQREEDVMGFLEGVGNQSLADINRTFGEEQGRAISDLVSRGLGGGGVKASIAHGFATRKADALARSREAMGAQKAATLAGLRGDTQVARANALGTAYGFDESTTGAYADQLNNQATNALDTFLGTTGDYYDFINNIQNMPPNTNALMTSAGGLGQGFANIGM